MVVAKGEGGREEAVRGAVTMVTRWVAVLMNCRGAMVAHELSGAMSGPRSC